MSKIDVLITIQKNCIHDANRLDEMGLGETSRDLLTVSSRIDEVLRLMWTTTKEECEKTAS